MAAGTGTPTSSPPPFPTSESGSPLFDYDDDDNDDDASSSRLPPVSHGESVMIHLVVCVGSIKFSKVGYESKEKWEEEVEKKGRRRGRGPAALVRTGRNNA